MVFSLHGDADMPALQPPAVPVPLDAPDFKVDEDLAVEGMKAYGQCGGCHGGFHAVSGGLAPDLRASSVVLSESAFTEIVRGGALRARGMPSYKALTDTHINALRHYIRQQAELGLAIQTER